MKPRASLNLGVDGAHSAMLTKAAIPRAVDTPSQDIVQTIDGREIVLLSDTRMDFGDVAGDESLSGRITSAAPIVDLVDRLACCLAERVTVDQGTVTVSIDRVGITGPIEHGDLLQMKGEVVSLGRSSIVTQMTCYRFDVEQAQLVEVARAAATLVAVDFKTLRPRAGLPELVHPTDPTYLAKLEKTEAQRKKLAGQWRAVQKKIENLPHISSEMIEDCGHDYVELVPIPDTELEVQTAFLPKNCNRNGTAYGADVVNRMDRVALQCAKGFTRNTHMMTESMSRISFQLPIRMVDMVAFVARVCSVRKYHVEVEVEVFISFVHSTKRRKSHTGYFTVANLDQMYQKKHVAKGLLVDEEDQDSMKTMLKAQHRRALDIEEQKLQPQYPLDLATSTNGKKMVMPTLHGRL